MDPNVEKELKAGERQLNEFAYKEALAKFKKAIKLDANCAPAYFGKAEASVCIPKLPVEEIYADYKKAVELDPENAFFLARLGAFCIDNEKWQEAEDAYNRASHIDSENARYYLSEFAIEYYGAATKNLDEEASNEELDVIRKKAFEYLAKSLDMTAEDALRLLSKK